MTLESLADRYWETINRAAPTIATVRGVHDHDTELPGFDDGWLGEVSQEFRSILTDTEALDEGGMTTQQRITRSLLVHQATSILDTLDTPFLLASIDPFTGPHTRLLSDTRQNTVKEASQADDLLERYAKVPAFLEGALEVQKSSADRGMSPAAAALERVMSQLDG